MKDLWHKLDSGLSTIYTSWLQIQEKGRAMAGFVHPDLRRGAMGAEVRLRYEGSLAEIERTGFQTTQVGPRPGNAFGGVRFEDLPRVVAHPGVMRLSYGSQDRPRLNRSIPYVHADAVRTYRDATHDYEGFSGREVVIAVLDTGLDFGHDFLQQPRASDSDEHHTRILRIWDPGLIPATGESGPRTELLDGRATYGVEYTEQQINDTLNDRGSVRVRHRDCSGHGTHVASIAAGNGGRDRRYVGMAPMAYIIGVKMLYLEAPPMDGIMVKSYDQRFNDAMAYVYNVVRLDLGDRRVVINYSVGSDQGPHDGLSQREEDLEHLLQSDPKRIFVAAAGNAGGAGLRALMTIPAGGTQIVLPMRLNDTRSASSMTDYEHCSVQETSVYPMTTEIWYAAPPPTPIGGTVSIEGVTDPITIPDLGRETQATTYGQGQMHKLVHGQDLGDIGGVRVLRNFIRLEIYPFRNNYHLREAMYDITLTGAAGQVLYGWGAGGGGYIFMRQDWDRTPAPAFTRTGEIDEPAGTASVIAVANFRIPSSNPDDDIFPTLSSKGPLIAYNPAAPARPAKPDIAAPGDDIHAARSRFSTRPGRCVTLPRHDAETSMGGTSMASPHVAGLIALMLEKNNTLTLADVRAAFRVLAGVGTDPVEFGVGVIDAQATLAAVPAP